MDAAPAGLEGEAAVGFDVAPTPGLGPLLHALELGVPMLAALAPGLGKAVLVGVIDVPRHVPGRSLSELAIIQAGERLQGVYAGAELVHAHVVLGPGQAVLQAREEDGDPVGLHVRMLGNELVPAVQGVQVKQVV